MCGEVLEGDHHLRCYVITSITTIQLCSGKNEGRCFIALSQLSTLS